MSKTFNIEAIEPLQARLNNHPIYSALHRVEDLQIFMSHHVYSVWDFMSVIKYLQSQIAPTTYPWKPLGDGSVRRFINELNLEEESDQGLPDENGEQTFYSHFELYCDAMREIGANPDNALKFIDIANKHGIEAALNGDIAPFPSQHFTKTTFDFIGSGKPHLVAVALAVGREHIIPSMFRAFLREMDITEKDAPIFHYYLKRHIHLDEDFHAPLSLRLLNSLCAGDEEKLQEAQQAAQQAIEARIAFWDEVLAAIRADAAK